MKQTLLLGGAVSALVCLLLGLVVWETWFAPEGSTMADEPLPPLGMSGGEGSQEQAPQPAPTPMRRGNFSGADDFHYARGSVALYQAANGTFLLRFEGYDAREGPDVYLYLTREAGDRTTSEVEGEGLRLRVPGGSEDGRATVRGSFNIFLDPSVNPLAYGGVTIWCDQFNHFFGHAPLA